MAIQENQPAPAIKGPVPLIPEGVDVGPFMLRTPMEIGFALRALIQKNDLISIYFNQGKDSFLSAVLQVDVKAQRFWFDVSGTQSLNYAATQADHLVFVAAPEGVKLQFALKGGVTLGNYDGGPALSSPFPAEMIKLQRREYFRLDTPIGRPLVCRLPHASGKVIELPLHDISIGGVGLWMMGAVDIQQMDVYKGCRIDLGTFGMIEVNLEIRSKRQVTRRDGSTQIMIGTRYVDLSRQTENLLQRYMAQLERERSQLRS